MAHSDHAPKRDVHAPISVTLCGDGGCGKSAITLRFVKSLWSDDYDPTIEDSYCVSRTIDGKTYSLELTDTAGQEEYRGLWAASNLRSDAFLMVYDITNKESLTNLAQFAELIKMEADGRAEDVVPLPSAHSDQPSSNLKFFSNMRRNSYFKPKRMVPRNIEPVIVVAGNKCDLEQARAVSKQEGRDWAGQHSSAFFETSARDMINIEQAFEHIVHKVIERRAQLYSDPVFADSAYGGSPSAGGPGSSFGASTSTEKTAEPVPDWDSPFDVSAFGGADAAGLPQSSAGKRARWRVFKSPSRGQPEQGPDQYLSQAYSAQWSEPGRDEPTRRRWWSCFS